MLSSVCLKNFKSFREATMKLSPLTFLIGPNASGKSNALEALRFLSLLARGLRLDDIEREMAKNTLLRGTVSDLFYNCSEAFELSISLYDLAVLFPELISPLTIGIRLDKEHLSITREDIPFGANMLYEVKSSSGDFPNSVIVRYNNFAPGGNKPEIPCSNKQAIFYQLDTPGRFSTKAAKQIIPVVKAFRETLQNIYFLDPRPAEMRGYSFIGDHQYLNETGSNLSSILYAICQDERKKDLLDFVKALPEQDIVDINFIKTERNDVMVSLVESFGGKHRNVDAPLLSDGTLRVLAVAAALLIAPSSATVIIEEIDNGIHPSRAKHMVEKLYEVGEQRNVQILVSSHNPALLDAVPNEKLSEVLCCFRDPQSGGSRILKLGDSDRFAELTAQGTLGQLMTMPILDQILKDQSTPEQRTAQALSWIQDFARAVHE